MAPSNTFFQQIPIETVKRIASEFPQKKPIGSDGHNTEVPGEVTSPRENWYDVAKKIQEEQDPKRMTELVARLIARLDEERLRKRPPLRRQAGDRSE